jgi:mono/diheme cytochrome c family protein
MRWTGWITVALCSLAVGAAAVAISCAPGSKPGEQAAMTPEQGLARGKYLVTIMGCNDCHTPGSFYGGPDSTRVLAGSELGWKGPWGISFASNLTPDPETGIGSWTEAQIVTAIRSGRRPDGSPILPPMPWPAFSGLTDEDAGAIAAYLKSLPAVKHTNLQAVPPGSEYKGAFVEFPPPPAWEAPKGAPPGDTPTSGAQ